MKHITIDEILDFVSFNEINEDTLRLSLQVNKHIRECRKCLCLVQAIQLIYDEFSRLGTGGNFKKYYYTSVSSQEITLLGRDGTESIQEIKENEKTNR